MTPELESMTKRGPEKAATTEQVYDLMEKSNRPVWTAKDVADHFNISRPTSTDRVKELEDEGWLETIEVGNATAYFIPDEENLSLEERHEQSIIREFRDKFVGLLDAPWTAVHPRDGALKAGDKVQILVEGVPGRWNSVEKYAWEKRRDELDEEEILADETQALISGELYGKPTTAIEHRDYPDDYNLEEEIGVEILEKGSSLLASGPKNYLIRPHNDAVFLGNVTVDWMSPRDDGPSEATFESDSPGL